MGSSGVFRNIIRLDSGANSVRDEPREHDFCLFVCPMAFIKGTFRAYTNANAAPLSKFKFIQYISEEFHGQV